MNLPNKLTLSRVIAIPIFIIFFVIGIKNEHIISLVMKIDLFRLFAAIIFVAASITDYFDGKIAREQNLVTDFGKLLDPLADKMLVITALILLTENKEVNYLCTLIVVLRELTISSIRLVALERGIVIAASIWGKLKTASQMVAIILILFNFYTINNFCYYLTYGIFYISTLFVIISLIDYIWKSRDVFKF
ncbi:MAG: CDP-diacylglycerol--glycerol-3-phosphate 3-phosphatidyltransferase [Lachnospiraceae bacterium]|nr:CDP-diacylglycerol--glycerol-3-phosphate 3-phosphatidyltransferase [Lachnospiraceae bacterium]